MPRWSTIEITDPTVLAWSREHPDWTNTGVRCGRIVGVDNDVLDPDLAAKVDDVAERVLGSTTFKRYGAKPAALRCYYNDTPIRKITITGGPGVSVEILCTGQQFAAIGDHAATGKPYEWPEDSPLTADADWAVPRVTPDALRQFARDLVSLFQANGYPDARATGDIEARTPRTASAAKGAPICVDNLVALLHHVPAKDDRAEWIKDLASLRSANLSDGDEETLLEIACRHSAGKYDGEPCAAYDGDDPVITAWNSLKPDVPNGRGVGSLIKEARENGYCGSIGVTTLLTRFADANVEPAAAADASSNAKAEHFFPIAVDLIRKTGDASGLAGGCGVMVVGKDQSIPFWVAVLNEIYTVVNRNGRMQVAHRRLDGKTDWLEFEAFKKLYCNVVVPSSASERDMQMGNAWLIDPQRRQAVAPGAKFMPGVLDKDVPAGTFNTWGGWPFDTSARGAGDWSKLRAHIRKIVCSSDDMLATWFLGWMAWCVQNLDRPAGVTPILTGVQGCGKTIVFEMLGELFGVHALQLNDPARLTQQFNEHLETALFCLADEALFAGDRKQAARMKALITDHNFASEIKGGATGMVKNHLRIAMTTNEEHAADFERTNRRYVAIAVKSDFARGVCGDAVARGYFDTIKAELKAGGFQAMLYDLLHADLTGFDVEAIPRTAESVEQKLNSLRGFDRWNYDCAYDGVIGRVPSNDWRAGPIKVAKAEAYDSYVRLCDQQGDHHPMIAANFARTLRKTLGGALGDRRPREGVGEERHRVWIMPPLSEFRAAFEHHIGEPGRIPWPD